MPAELFAELALDHAPCVRSKSPAVRKPHSRCVNCLAHFSKVHTPVRNRLPALRALQGNAGPLDRFRSAERMQSTFRKACGHVCAGRASVMRVRITTPNVLKVLRKRNPEIAKPYNFVLSPILIQPSPDCTLVAPASKHPEEWLTREYTEIHSGEAVNLGSEYNGKTLTPQTLSSVIWRHFLHPEDKSLSPDGQLCSAYTRGLLLRRPVAAISPLIPIGGEIERRSQEGEDICVLDNVGPVKYHPRKTANTRPADVALIQRARRFPKKLLRSKSRVSQHAIDRFLDGERTHPGTRQRLAQAVEKLENRDR